MLLLGYSPLLVKLSGLQICLKKLKMNIKYQMLGMEIFQFLILCGPSAHRLACWQSGLCCAHYEWGIIRLETKEKKEESRKSCILLETKSLYNNIQFISHDIFFKNKLLGGDHFKFKFKCVAQMGHYYLCIWKVKRYNYSVCTIRG